jgi:branched-chain amino acid transport system permease protein
MSEAVLNAGRARAASLAPVRVDRQTTSSRIALALGVLAIAVMVAMPWWSNAGTMRRVVELSCYLAIAQMWNLLAGYSGLVAVGPQAFIGAGGYALYILSLKFGVNPFLAAGLSVALPALLAVPAYLLVHRLEGPYFAIGTWVVAEAVRLLTTNLDYVNAGAGLTLRVMSQFTAHQRDIGLVWLSAALLVATVGGLFCLLQSRFGLALTAMRDNPVAAESQGVNVRRLRFVVFVLAAAGSGLAGAIYYMAQVRITPASGFNPQWASICVFIVMVGGIGSIEGPIIGALIYFLADRFFSQYGATYLVVLGVVTVLIALYARTGVWGLICRVVDAPWFPIGRKLVRPSR